jgi:3-deoxy-7-phosphoheptulonate synthase
MIVVLRHGCAQSSVMQVTERLTELGYSVKPIFGVEKTVVAAVGGEEHRNVDVVEQLRSYPDVEDVLLVTRPYKYVALETHPGRTRVDLGDGVVIGGAAVVLMAGPCTVESEEQTYCTAEAVSAAGATVLRGGAFKPSTSPYSFQGLGVEGLRIMRGAADRYGMKVVTEVMDPRKVEIVSEYADVLQVGTRNMQNYDLLKEVGLSRRAVLLKRGMSAKYEELLLAAEYVATAGNERVILCERGIRTFEAGTRNTLDIGAVPVLKSLSHLPVVVDPSQGTGRRDLVGPLSLAAVAAGADGLLIEAHPSPDHALKDGPQSLTLEGFAELVPGIVRIAAAVGRSVDRGAAPAQG